MANNILGTPYTATAANLYALVRNTAGQVLTVSGLTFAAYATANLANYVIALTEQGTASRFYALTFPAIPIGVYEVTIYLRAGGSPAEGDTAVATGEVYWTGTAIVDAATRLENVDAAVTTRLAPTTAGRTLDVTAANKVNGVVLVDTLTTYTGNTPQTGDSFARIGLAGVGLTNVVLPSGGLANVSAWTVAITGNITGNLSGSVGSMTGNVGGNVVGSVGSVLGGLNTTSGVITTLDALDTAQDSQHNTTQTSLGTVSTNVSTLLTRITSTLFTGITSLAEWLGLLAGKQTGNSTARTEIRATGAGSGTYVETTDSLEALRDRGDAAWVTATGFSTLDAAGIRDAVGLASANLDTQFGTLATTAALNALLTTAMTESYNADGSPPTPAQALFFIMQRLSEFSISGTQITVKKLNGSTTAFVLTMDAATSPTSSTRSS